jgi:hypothetical protein
MVLIERVTSSSELLFGTRILQAHRDQMLVLGDEISQGFLRTHSSTIGFE